MNSAGEQFDCVECMDAAPYVLGALADPEAFREHLATCAVCQAEVAKLQPVADTLPTTVRPEIAPEAMRRRVLARVRSEAALSGARAEAEEAPKRTSRARSRRRWITAALALGASAALVIALTLGTGSSHRGQVTSTHVAIQGANASLLKVGARFELLVSGMPQPPVGKIYQVWLKRGGATPQPTDALFGVTSQGRGAVAVPDNLHGVKEVLVTSEPRGGSSHPTSQPLISVSVRA
jgi:anti-sigma-K factor RskA